MSTIVIVCEGAVDTLNNPIKSEKIKEILEDCGLDARVTVLGHIQRGGSPSAFDRYLATLQGIEAVQALLDSDPKETPSLMIGIKENRITRLPLLECVKTTKNIAQKIKLGDFTDLIKLRGRDFQANYEIIQGFYNLEEAQAAGIRVTGKPLRIAFLNCGAPCCGINAANRAIIMHCLFKGHQPFAIYNGFSGLIKGDIREVTLEDGPFMAEKGGSFLGMNRSLPWEDLGLAAYYLQKEQIDGLIIIGGFEAFTAQLQLTEARKEYPAFDIPLICLPATISNNVPGTDFSVGCDTALNIIVNSADSLKQSASSSRKRTFVVDVQGGNCGYLATMGGLASGAVSTYIPEEGITLKDLINDIDHLKSRFSEDKRQGRLVLRNENASDIFTAELIAKIFQNESNGLFDARWATLGHLQQGGSPSPLDRIRATRLAVLCISFVESVLRGTSISFGDDQNIDSPHNLGLDCFGLGSSPNSKVDEDSPRKTLEDSSSVVIGIRGPSVVFTCCKKLKLESDLRLRRPNNQWWFGYRPLAKILAKYNL